MPKVDIDGKMYLIKKSQNSYAPSLVISAHGGIKQNGSPTFHTRWGTLHFYSVHGQVTNDLGIRNFCTGGKESQRTESLAATAKCFDYDLSKYQGKHNKAGETYESIEADQDYVDQFNALLVEAGDRAPAGSKMMVDFDVLTIRNRWNSRNVTLSAALSAVGGLNQYSDVHCYFCRSFY
jgi:hypothetical protein